MSTDRIIMIPDHYGYMCAHSRYVQYHDEPIEENRNTPECV